MQCANNKKEKKEKKREELEVVCVILNNALMYGSRSGSMEANRSRRPSQLAPRLSATRVVFALHIIKDDKFS